MVFHSRKEKILKYNLRKKFQETGILVLRTQKIYVTKQRRRESTITVHAILRSEFEVAGYAFL